MDVPVIAARTAKMNKSLMAIRASPDRLLLVWIKFGGSSVVKEAKTLKRNCLPHPGQSRREAITLLNDAGKFCPLVIFPVNKNHARLARSNNP